MDIDAYAGCIAYAELLRCQGHQAQAVSEAPLNESIPERIRAWKAPLVTSYQPQPDDTFSLVDISEEQYFSSFVDNARIDTVIDHHPGLEAYWQARIGADNTHIEHIGAACTQVYELWKAAGLLDQMSQVSARLLVCGILDNTLNFGARITTDRDKAAYHDLMERAALPEDWPAQYFTACQASIMQDVAAAIGKDTKHIQFKTFTEPMRVGQAAIWSADDVLSDPITLQKAMEDIEPYWFVNIIALNEGRSYFFCQNAAVKVWLEELLDVHFSGDLARAPRMWLRKEIMKEDQSTVEL